jgi:hypothetical protein
MPDLYRINLADQIAEVEREVKLREKVYPHQVATKRLSQDRADWQIAVMREVAASLRLLNLE